MNYLLTTDVDSPLTTVSLMLLSAETMDVGGWGTANLERVSEQGKCWRSTVVRVSRKAVELCAAASLKHKSFLVLMRRRALAKLGIW